MRRVKENPPPRNRSTKKGPRVTKTDSVMSRTRRGDIYEAIRQGMDLNYEEKAKTMQNKLRRQYP